MNVKELIKELKKYPEDSEVFFLEEKEIKTTDRRYLSSEYTPLTSSRIMYGLVEPKTRPCVKINITNYNNL